MWCLPGKPSAEFVCAMEDVLDVYQRPYDPKHPLVCLDETCKQLIGETQRPLPVAGVRHGITMNTSATGSPTSS